MAIKRKSTEKDNIAGGTSTFYARKAMCGQVVKRAIRGTSSVVHKQRCMMCSCLCAERTLDVQLALSPAHEDGPLLHSHVARPAGEEHGRVGERGGCRWFE